MLCPYCNSDRLTTSRTGNIHVGRLDCGDCNSFIKWLPKANVDKIPLFEFMTDASSTACWDNFLKLVSVAEREILTDHAIKVGLFNKTLTIVLDLPEDDSRFVDLIDGSLVFSEILKKLRGYSVEIRLSTKVEWAHASACTLERYADVFKKNSLPQELVFTYYYAGIINYREIGSIDWLIAQIDEVVLSTRQNNYQPAWAVKILTNKYYFSREALSYLGRSLDYHPAWAEKSYHLYKPADR
jgi:hypothetical protein